MLDTIVYEVEYLYVHKSSLTANNIAEILFSKAAEEGNIFVLFDKILDCHVDGTETMQKDAFGISKNGRKRKR